VFKNLFQLFILKGFSSSLEISLQIYLFSWMEYVYIIS
jgi:hypothetical protein